LQPFFKELNSIQGLVCEENVSLAPLTTMKVGGRARLFLTPLTITALERLLYVIHQQGICYKVLGNGSNIIVEDGGVGVVLNLSLLNKIQPSDKDRVYVEAGCTLSTFLKWCICNGFSGLEPLAGIPGSFGGAIFMNAGANGVSIGDFIDELYITTSTGSFWVKVSNDFFGYRKSYIPTDGLISAAKLRLCQQREEAHSNNNKKDALWLCDGSRIRNNLKKIMKKRLSSQPLGHPSAGCIFKNPSPDCSAWSLIAACGLQGFRLRDAQVSPKHANFIVNLGHATSNDVLDLIKLVKERVWEGTGVALKEEVVVWHHEKDVY